MPPLAASPYSFTRVSPPRKLSSDWETVPVTTPMWNLAPVVPVSGGVVVFLQPATTTATSINESKTASSFFILSSSPKKLARIQLENEYSRVAVLCKVSSHCPGVTPSTGVEEHEP